MPAQLIKAMSASAVRKLTVGPKLLTAQTLEIKIAHFKIKRPKLHYHETSGTKRGIKPSAKHKQLAKAALEPDSVPQSMKLGPTPTC